MEYIKRAKSIVNRTLYKYHALKDTPGFARWAKLIRNVRLYLEREQPDHARIMSVMWGLDGSRPRNKKATQFALRTDLEHELNVSTTQFYKWKADIVFFIVLCAISEDILEVWTDSEGCVRIDEPRLGLDDLMGRDLEKAK